MTTKKDPASLVCSRLWARVKCWLCKKIGGDRFFNIDASREIDRLLLENERLRAGCAK